jgi:ribosomal protein L37AE/L43A
VTEGRLVGVDENVKFEPSCPNCGHEDVHFADRTWVCDCCGYSW